MDVASAVALSRLWNLSILWPFSLFVCVDLFVFPCLLMSASICMYVFVCLLVCLFWKKGLDGLARATVSAFPRSALMILYVSISPSLFARPTLHVCLYQSLAVYLFP